MAAARNASEQPRKRRPPARSPEARENQLINLAFDAAERMLTSPNPPAQIVLHYAKSGTRREQLERLRLEGEVNLLRRKVEAMESATRVEALYEQAINAMKAYSGQDVEIPDEN